MVTFKYHSVYYTAEQKAPSSFAQSHSLMAHLSHSNLCSFQLFMIALGLSKLLFYVFILTTPLLISNHYFSSILWCILRFYSDFFLKGGERFLSFFFTISFKNHSFGSRISITFMYSFSNCLCFARFVFSSLVSLHSLGFPTSLYVLIVVVVVIP